MKKQFLITKISKHLLYAMLVAVTFGGLLGCEDAHLEAPLIVTGVCVNNGQEHSSKGKYIITFNGQCLADAKYYTDTKYSVGDTLK